MIEEIGNIIKGKDFKYSNDIYNWKLIEIKNTNINTIELNVILNNDNITLWNINLDNYMICKIYQNEEIKEYFRHEYYCNNILIRIEKKTKNSLIYQDLIHSTSFHSDGTIVNYKDYYTNGEGVKYICYYIDEIIRKKEMIIRDFENNTIIWYNKYYDLDTSNLIKYKILYIDTDIVVKTIIKL